MKEKEKQEKIARNQIGKRFSEISVFCSLFSLFSIHSKPKISSMSQLNPQQLEAVETINGPLLINAGAGSGKTHTITERVVSMIHTK